MKPHFVAEVDEVGLLRLQKFMQTKLVKRTPKGVELTTSGEAVYAHARRLRLAVEDISREVTDLGRGHAGHLRIASAASFANHLVPLACENLLKEAPKITLRMTVADRGDMLTALRGGELDLVVATLQVPDYEDLVVEHLFDDDYVVYAAASHRLARRRLLTLVDLTGERWAMGSIDGPTERLLRQAFGNAGLPSPRIAIETAYLPARNNLIATSELLGFTSRSAVRYASRNLPLTELRVKHLAYTRRVGVVYRKDSYLSPAARRFIEILKATARKISG